MVIILSLRDSGAGRNLRCRSVVSVKSNKTTTGSHTDRDLLFSHAARCLVECVIFFFRCTFAERRRLSGRRKTVRCIMSLLDAYRVPRLNLRHLMATAGTELIQA